MEKKNSKSASLEVRNAVKEYRQRHRLNQAELAELLDCTQRDICWLEKYGNMPFRLALKLSQVVRSIGGMKKLMLELYPDCDMTAVKYGKKRKTQ